MKKQILSEELRRMKQLAGLINESENVIENDENLNEIMGVGDKQTFERLTSEMTNSIDTYESASSQCAAESGPPGDPHSGAVYNMCMQNVEYPKDKLKNNLAEWKRIDSNFQYMDDKIAQKLMRFFSKSSKGDLANV